MSGVGAATARIRIAVDHGRHKRMVAVAVDVADLEQLLACADLIMGIEIEDHLCGSGPIPGHQAEPVAQADGVPS